MSFLEQTVLVATLALLVYLVHISRTNRFFQSYVHQDKIKVLISLLLSVMLVSCKPQSLVKRPESCKEFCTSKNNPLASVIIEDPLCHSMFFEAWTEGEKLGYCDDGSKTTGNKPQHPDSAQCKALLDKSQEECKKMPRDPSQTNQIISGSATFKGGNPVRVNGKPVVVIKGEVCICDEEQTTAKTSPGKTTK